MKQKNHSNDKQLAQEQTKLIRSLEGIGDILVFEAKRRSKNKTVLEGLKKISDIIKRLFSIQREDPDKFDKIVLSQELFNLFQEDKQEAQLRLAFDPTKYLICFSSALNQILRIHEEAIKSKNDEISRFAVYHLNWILAEVSQTQNNHLFVEQLLRSLAEGSRKAVEENDVSMYAASIHWYTDIIFNRLKQREGNFNLGYLELFDRYFFFSVRTIVTEEQTKLFQSLISSLVERVSIPSYLGEEIWNYGHLILYSDLEKYREVDKEHKIDERIIELDETQGDIDTQEKLENWIGRFNDLKTKIEPQLNSSQKDKAKEIEDEIIEFANSQFKYNNLLEIVFAIGAYCLFKQRMDYIRYLWEYKQPPDSDATWVGHDIIPSTIDGVIKFYFRKGLFERRFDFWEGHHGTRGYFRKYFLLLLLFVLHRIRKNQNGKYPEIENYNLPKLPVYRLSDLEHSSDEFVGISKELKTETDTLRMLGFNIDQLEELFSEKLVPFLSALKTKAQERIKSIERDEPISPQKVDEFKKQVVEAFTKSANFRIILKHFGLFEDRTLVEEVEGGERLGINIIDDKAAFFEEWYVSYSRWGENYGKQLAQAENLDLFGEIAAQCKEIKEDQLSRVLDGFADLSSVIMLGSRWLSLRYSGGKENFKPKWTVKSDAEMKGLVGWYLYKDREIPVYEVFHSGADQRILTINKSKFGKLIQQSPFNANEDRDLKKDIFYMNVQEVSRKQELLEEFTKNPPPWLLDKGDKEKQVEYLKGKVLIQIFERYEFSKDQEFEGYLMRVERK